MNTPTSHIPPPHDTWADGHSPDRRASPVPAMLAGAGLVVVGLMIGLFVGGIGGFIAGYNVSAPFEHFFEDAEATLTVSAPDTTAAQDTFTVLLTIENTSESARQLHSVDLYTDDVMFEVVSTDPPSRPGESDAYYHELLTTATVDPLSSREITLRLKPLTRGEPFMSASVYFNDYRSVDADFMLSVTDPSREDGQPGF